MYQRMGVECKKSLKKQFDFSTSELEQIEKFMEDNVSRPVGDILDAVMKDVNLNDRQKVILSYTLGASVGAETAMQDLKRSNAENVGPVLNMKLGQGG